MDYSEAVSIIYAAKGTIVSGVITLPSKAYRENVMVAVKFLCRKYKYEFVKSEETI